MQPFQYQLIIMAKCFMVYFYHTYHWFLTI